MKRSILILVALNVSLLSFAESSGNSKQSSDQLEKEFIEERAEVKAKLEQLERNIDDTKDDFDEKLKDVKDNLNREIEDVRRDLNNSITHKLWIIGIILAIVGIIGLSTIKKWIRNKIDDYIENKADQKIEKTLSDEFVRNIVEIKGKAPMDEILSKIEQKGIETIKGLKEKGEATIDQIKSDGSLAINLVTYQTKGKSVEKQFKLALSEADPNAAIELYTQLIKLQPENIVFYNNRGVRYNQIIEYELAIKDYDRAIEISPEFILARTNKANVLVAQNKLDECQDLITDVLNSDSNNAMAISIQGILHMKSENEQKAIEWLQKALSISSTYGPLYFNRGYYFLESKHPNLNLAILDFEKALELGYEGSDLYNNMAVVYRRLKDYKKAVALLDKAKKMVGVNPNIYGTMALIFADQKNEDEFYAYLEVALEKGCPVWLYLKDEGFDDYRDSPRLTNMLKKYQK